MFRVKRNSSILSPDGNQKIVLLSDKEVEIIVKLKSQAPEICQRMNIKRSSKQLVMQTKNTLTNMKVAGKFYSMIVTKLLLRARKIITRNC